MIFFIFERIFEEKENQRRKGKEWKKKSEKKGGFKEKNGVEKARVSSFKAKILCFGAFLDRQSI